MTPVYWSLLIGLAAVIVGIILGVGGLLLLPIIGVVAAIAIFFWLAQRKSENKPPVE